MRITQRWLTAAAAAGALALAAGVRVGAGQGVGVRPAVRPHRPTQTVGVFLCPGYHDYIALLNSKGGIEGYKVRVLEIDNEYKVPPAMEAHERFKKEGAILEALRHAADSRADQEARGGQDPRYLAPASAPQPPPMAGAIPIPSRSPPAIGRRAQPLSPSSRRSWAAA